MGIRETMKEKPAVGVAVGAAFVLFASAMLAWSFWPERRADLLQAWYTVDEGKTWFADSATRVAPFDKDGKQALIAFVYTYAGGSKSFCAYLAKYTPEGKKAMEASMATATSSGKRADAAVLLGDREFMKHAIVVKRPGDSDWIPYGDPRATAIFTIKSSDGSPVDQLMIQ